MLFLSLLSRPINCICAKPEPNINCVSIGTRVLNNTEVGPIYEFGGNRLTESMRRPYPSAERARTPRRLLPPGEVCAKTPLTEESSIMSRQSLLRKFTVEMKKARL